MERKDIVIGIVIVAILALVIYWLRRPETPQITVLPSPTPSIEQSIESVFNVDIPESGIKTCWRRNWNSPGHEGL